MSLRQDRALRSLNAESRVRRAICDWLREDAPVAVQMSVMPGHVAALARRLSDQSTPAPPGQSNRLNGGTDATG